VKTVIMAKLEYRKVKEVEIKDVNHGKRGRDTSWGVTLGYAKKIYCIFCICCRLKHIEKIVIFRFL